MYEGKIVGISRRQDTYEGNTIEKVLVVMEDDSDEKTPRVTIQFSLESWFSVTFFARLAPVINAPRVRVGVYQSDMNEKVSFCYMRKITPAGAEKVEADKSFPKPVKHKIGNKEVVDYSEVVKAADALIAKVNAANTWSINSERDIDPAVGASLNSLKTQGAAKPSPGAFEASGDLPF